MSTGVREEDSHTGYHNLNTIPLQLLRGAGVAQWIDGYEAAFEEFPILVGATEWDSDAQSPPTSG